MEPSPPGMFDRTSSSSSTGAAEATTATTATATTASPATSSSKAEGQRPKVAAAAAAVAAAAAAAQASSGGPPGPSPPSALRVKNFPPSGGPKQGGDSNGGELAELNSTEISLDLQGLIDDANFNDDNLFGDLGDAKRNELNNVGSVYQQVHHYNGARTSPTGSLGPSSGHSSPTGGPEAPGATPVPPPQGPNPAAAAAAGQPPVGYHPNYRNALPYLPGSVHHTGYTPPSSGAAASSSTNVQVKQEPSENHHAHHHNHSHAPSHHNGGGGSFNTNNNNTTAYSNGTVSSTTPGAPGGYVAPVTKGSALPSLASFAKAPAYLTPGHGTSMSKKKMDRNSDEYRRRRERNNVAVRKSREKAKVRTKETEERVKILARENERMQKKVELLQEELGVLRSLFSNVGVLPEHIHRELSKHMENFAQQHNAMASAY